MNTDPFSVLARWLVPPAQLITNEPSTRSFNEAMIQGREREIELKAAAIRASQRDATVTIRCIELNALALRLAQLERAAR